MPFKPGSIGGRARERKRRGLLDDLDPHVLHQIAGHHQRGQLEVEGVEADAQGPVLVLARGDADPAGPDWPGNRGSVRDESLTQPPYRLSVQQTIELTGKIPLPGL